MSDATPTPLATPTATPLTTPIATPIATSQSDAGSFEESTRRLSQIVAELEGGDLPLERSLQLFEEGVRLARSAQERLERAERRVEELLGIDAQGKPIVREFEG